MDRSLSLESTSTFRLTDHAAVRLQQRGIPSWFLRLLVEHGKTTHDGHGAFLKSISKASKQRLRQALTRQEYARAERCFGVYAVILVVCRGISV